ncbi:MAG: LemA family protein [Pseudomonadota bacterium]
MKRSGAKLAIGTGVVVLVIYFLLAGPYNTVVRLEESMGKAQGDVEVNLQRRLDLLPNLLETVKGFASQERQALAAVGQARQKSAQAQGMGQKLLAGQELTQALGRLLVAVEHYPDLLANKNFRALKDQLEGTEDRLAVDRAHYILAVQEYNQGIHGFPTMILARLMGCQPRPVLAAQPPAAPQP